MQRRDLLVAAASAAVASLAGCGRPAPDPDPVTTISPAAGPHAVASWQLTGGLLPPGAAEIEAPRLAVYGDGRAIADARHHGSLSAAELSDLVSQLTADLRNVGGTPTPAGGMAIADAPTAVLTVRSSGGTFSVRAYGLDELRDNRAYPAPIYAARDRLHRVYEQVVKGAQPYTAGRVRIVATRVEPDPSAMPDAPGPDGPPAPAASSTAGARPWPADVPVPTQGSGQTSRADLTGAAARAAAEKLGTEAGTWSLYRLTDGAQLRAAWRYLLPDE